MVDVIKRNSPKRQYISGCKQRGFPLQMPAFPLNFLHLRPYPPPMPLLSALHP